MAGKQKDPFQVIYEDNHLLIVNKEPGVLVQGDNTGDATLLDYCKTYLKDKYQKPGNVFLHPVHRLDRPVSGAVILARTSKGLERMSQLFQKKQVDKLYWAVVRKKPPEKSGTLTHWLKKDHEKNVVTAFDREVPESKKATLNYKVLGNLNNHYLIQIQPVTGRPHQIRVQLAAMGCPIRGDVKYGFHKANEDGSINLHAKILKFTHPIKKEAYLFQAPLPNTRFWEQFLSLEPKKRDARIKNKYLDHLY